MADVSGKIRAILRLVEDGSYFVINRPRQYGKTTTLFLLERELARRDEYLPFFLSFEGFDAAAYEHAQSFIKAFQVELRQIFKRAGLVELLPLFDSDREIITLHEFGGWLSNVIETSRKQIVLMIDEVDKSSNHQLFLDFLALLRSKFLLAAQGKTATFHSIILAGVHDIKTKIRPDDERRYNSPWNIAVDFTIDMSLTPPEIESMLADYSAQRGVAMNCAEMAAHLHAFTSGYPFLVSKLCKILDEDLFPDAREWLPEHLDQAVNRLLYTQNTNFDSLIKNLENHPDLYQLVEKIVIGGEEVMYNLDNPLIHLGLLYGIFARSNGGGAVRIHNRIYSERMYNYMISNFLVQTLIGSRVNEAALLDHYTLPDGGLDMDRLLRKFQEFMKSEYSQRDRDFIERNGRLVFLAFLKPILNGKGFDFKEPQISEEKRLDVAITYNARKYIVELKVWRGDAAHQRGLAQLGDYLERANLTTGYLIIFDLTQGGQKTWKQEHIQLEHADISAVWV